MSCANFDLKAYLLGELEPNRAAEMRAHLAACQECREEFERLELTRATLLVLRDEEIPRRIAFVCDAAPGGSWWRRLWAPGPRWAFASALVVSLAILVHGMLRSAPPPPTLDTAALEQRISAEVERRLQSSLRQALAEAESRQQERFQQALAVARQQWEFQRKADLLAVEENFNVLKKRMNVLQVHLASNWEGGVR